MAVDKKKAMAELGIDEDTFNELLKEFIEPLEEEIKNLQDVIDSGNCDEIAKAAHGIKGMVGNMRIVSMEDAAKTIEQLAKTRQDTQAMLEKIQDLKTGLEELRNEVG